MTLEAAKELDRRCVWYWLNEVYVDPSSSYSRHTDDEIRVFAHDALVLLKEQEADKWIPVTERLPEVRNAVLCYSPHHKNIWALSLHEDGEWYYWIPMYQKYNPDFEGPITHWMPLPEHPKEGR